MEEKKLVVGRNTSRILAISLVAFGIIVFRTTISFLGQLTGHRLIIAGSLFITFGILFLLFSYGSWRRKDWGYLGGIVATIAFFIVANSDLLRILSNPADPNFIYTVAFVIFSLVVIVSGIYKLYAAQKEKPIEKENIRRVLPSSTNISTTEKEHSSSAIQPRKSNKTFIIGILQFIVGAIFVFGGIALLYFTTGTSDMILGGIHTSLGIASFPVGYGILIAKKWGRNSALALNPIAIAFSTLAEILLFIESSLAVSAFNDSVVGTIIGIAFATAVLVSLSRQTSRSLFT